MVAEAAGERLGAAVARVRLGLGRLRPTHPAHWILLALVVAGVVIRGLGIVSWWPVTTVLADSYPYAYYAEFSPLDNPQHPAGYSWLLSLIGVVTREVSALVLLQHLGGIATGLLLYAAVGRLTGSPWPGLAPAAIVLLSGDQAFLEHSVMSEAPFTLAVAGSLYAAVRAIDAPEPWWGWPLGTGVLVTVSVVIRSAGLLLVGVIVLAFILARSEPWRRRLIAPAAIAGPVVVGLLAYAIASSAVNGRFEISPTQGWHLYARVAPFADCDRFDPPEGTEVLCESTPPAERSGLDFYLYDERSPALENFDFYDGDSDGVVGDFAREVVLNQPGDYLDAIWTDLKGYYVPSGYPFRFGQGGNLTGQVDWSISLPPDVKGEPAIRRETEAGMESFFNPFSVDLDPPSLDFLADYQRVARFGATALSATTLLTLLGLLVGPRRNRVGVLLFGVGGLTMLVAPTLSVYYLGRYTVPIAGPLVAAAAIAAFSVWRMEAARRKGAREQAHARG